MTGVHGLNNKVEDLISIIVPVYNVDKYLKQSVDSILSQTYKNLEIILVDDGSTDCSGKICDEFAEKDCRVKVIHKANGGQGKARNCGIEISSGKYLSFLDSDDFMESGCIEELYRILEDRKADVSVCSYNYVSDDGKFVKKFISEEGEHTYTGYEALAFMWNDTTMSIAPWAKLFRRDFWGDFRFRECYAEDAASMPYLYNEDTVVAYTGKPLVNYRLRTTSDVRSFSRKKLFLLDIFDEMCDYADKNLPHDLQTIVSGKRIAANIHVFFQLPETGYDDERKRIKRTVRKSRWKVILSPLVRKKTRIAAFITLFGYNTAKSLFSMLRKKDPSI